MKKTILTLLALAAGLLTIASCTKTYDTYVVGPELQTIIINVDQSHWAYSNLDNNNYFYSTVDMPEITKDVFNYGLIKMYRTYDFTSSNPSQIELPYVRHNEYQISGDNWGFYTETVDYEICLGQIIIYYTASDFDYELDEAFIPDSMQFRCVICR